MIRTAFPRPRDDDSEDVIWALSTAHALWLKDHRADALVWLQRASTAAADAGEAFRAEELAHAARSLRIALEDEAFDSLRPASPPPPHTPPSPPPASQIQPSPVQTPVRPPPFSPPSSGHDFLDPWAEKTPVRPAVPEAAVITSALPLDELRRNSKRPKAPETYSAPPPLPKPPPVVVAPTPLPPAPPEEEEAEPEVTTVRPDTPPPSSGETEALPLDDVAAFADLPDDARLDLGRLARIEELGPQEELAVSGLLLVLEGEAHVQPTVLDTTAATMQPGEIVFARGSLARGLSLRLVAESGPVKIAAWSDEVISLALSSLPWVLEELRAHTDRLQAFAGAALGPLGERFDVQLRQTVLDRLRLRVLHEGDVFVEKGRPVQGMAILGSGVMTLERGDDASSKVLPGDLLFPAEILQGGLAPATARAGAGGAILLFGDRALAQELLLTWPPLIEVLASA